MCAWGEKKMFDSLNSGFQAFYLIIVKWPQIYCGLELTQVVQWYTKFTIQYVPRFWDHSLVRLWQGKPKKIGNNIIVIYLEKCKHSALAHWP